MGGLNGNAFGALGKKISKIDPLRGGDKILEGIGLPTLTGEGDKNILGSTPEQQEIKVPNAPTVDDALAADDASRSLARRRGRTSTVLANTNFNQISTANKSLLGG